MIVTVTGPVRKLCPYKDEVDEGTATLTFDVADGDAPELHGVAKFLAGLHDASLSHEGFTRLIARHPSVTHARTTWTTAGLEVTVDVPDRRE